MWINVNKLNIAVKNVRLEFSKKVNIHCFWETHPKVQKGKIQKDEKQKQLKNYPEERWSSSTSIL